VSIEQKWFGDAAEKQLLSPPNFPPLKKNKSFSRHLILGKQIKIIK
jgi:hypothetical protein